jgi:hypothetical protein
MIIDDGGLWYTGDPMPTIPDPENKPKYNSSSLVEFLEDLGYNVDTRGMAQTYRSKSKNEWSAAGDYGLYDGTDDLAAYSWYEGQDWRLQALLDADLIIHTRFMSSGTYNRENDLMEWNELEVPLLSQNGHMVRTGKLAWNNGANVTQSNTETDYKILPFGLGFTVFDWTAYGGAPISHPIQTPEGDWDAASKVFAQYDCADIMVNVPAGTDFDALNGTTDKYGVAGERRYYFGIWGYDGNTTGTPGYDWAACLTDEYKALLAYVIADMIPEPATIALLGLGGLSLLRKRR